MGWVVNATPRPLYPRYPLYRRLRGPQGRFGRMRKISPPPGFDPRTVQPVASHYTDYAIPTHIIIIIIIIIIIALNVTVHIQLKFLHTSKQKLNKVKYTRKSLGI